MTWNPTCDFECQTPSIEFRMEPNPNYNLEERLLNYAGKIVELYNVPYTTYAAQHVSRQLLRSGTSPLANHGEAESSESTKDFIHKLSLSLKELRESNRWLLLLQKTNVIPNAPAFPHLLDETDQLIRIFVSSIKTAKKRL